MKVFKYHVPVQDEFTLQFPAGYKILHVETLGGDTSQDVYMWVLVDPDQPVKIQCQFQVKGTGHDIKRDILECVGTVITDGGTFVWHYFRVASQGF